MQRLHGLMYGLYYPAVLGARLVVILQHLSAQSGLDSVTAVAITSGVFFSLSFASAQGLEGQYGLAAFALDIAEVFGMFGIFVLLKLIEPPPMPAPALDYAYAALIVIVIMQLLWRANMDMQWNTYLDLKLLLFALLIVGVFLGPRHDWINWVITLLFAIIASVYVASRPYERTGPTWWVRRSSHA